MTIVPPTITRYSALGLHPLQQINGKAIRDILHYAQTFRSYDEEWFRAALGLCRKWREVAIASPSLWTEVITDSLPILGMFLNYSKSLPIKIYFRLDEEQANKYSLGDDLITLLGSHAARIESFMLVIPPELGDLSTVSLLKFFYLFDTPKLQKLSIIHGGVQHIAPPAQWIHGGKFWDNFLQVQELNLFGPQVQFNPQDLSRCSRLTSLSMHHTGFGAVGTDVSTILNILRSLPNLREAMFTRVFPSPFWHGDQYGRFTPANAAQVPIVYMPKLRYITLEDEPMEQLAAFLCKLQGPETIEIKLRPLPWGTCPPKLFSQSLTNVCRPLAGRKHLLRAVDIILLANGMEGMVYGYPGPFRDSMMPLLVTHVAHPIAHMLAERSNSFYTVDEELWPHTGNYRPFDPVERPDSMTKPANYEPFDWSSYESDSEDEDYDDDWESDDDEDVSGRDFVMKHDDILSEEYLAPAALEFRRNFLELASALPIHYTGAIRFNSNELADYNPLVNNDEWISGWVEMLATQCPQLRDFRVMGRDGVKLLRSLIHYRNELGNTFGQKLRRMTIHSANWGDLDQEGLIDFLNRPGSQLVRVRFSECTVIDQGAFSKFVNFCPKSLEIYLNGQSWRSGN